MVRIVRLDRHGISDNGMPVGCMELNVVHIERDSQIPLRSPSANWDIATCLLCPLGHLLEMITVHQTQSQC
jgi:hypothetical protein